MLRKRHEKVRTGCLTCKQRRVKCDEARPSCRRCTVSRRECRGYELPPVGNFSWQQLLDRREPCLPVDAAESRCLSYYHRVVAPSLAQSLDDTFWVVHVSRLLHHEPAARHAVLALSALHEDFVASLPNRASERLDRRTGLTSRLELKTDLSFGCVSGLKHYNNAIRMVLEDRISNNEVLLTISLLFTCIELLQGSVSAAVKHCQHGVRVHNNQRLSTELSAAFDQLGFFLNTFGTSRNSTLPETLHPQGDFGLITVDQMYTLGQASQALDAIIPRGAKMLGLASLSIKKGDDAPCSIETLELEKFQVLRGLRLWWERFVSLKWRLLSSAPLENRDAATLRLLEARWLVSNILVQTCFSDSEKTFDLYMDYFRRVVELGEQEDAARRASGAPRPSFSFDMGYLPLLHIVGIKCRNLQLRVRALVLMKDLARERETIWDACFIYSTAKWAAEFEHGLMLDEERMRSKTNPYPDEHLPSDAKRLVGFNNADDADLEVDSEGYAVVRRRIFYYTAGPEGISGPLCGYTTMRL